MTERQRDRETERQTDRDYRETGRQGDRETQGQMTDDLHFETERQSS